MLAVFALSRVAFVTQPVAEQWAAKELMEASWGVLAAALALATLAAARASSRGAPLSSRDEP